MWRWGLLRHNKHIWAAPLIRIDYVHLIHNIDLMLVHYVPTKDNESMLEIRSATVPVCCVCTYVCVRICVCVCVCVCNGDIWFIKIHFHVRIDSMSVRLYIYKRMCVYLPPPFFPH